jgi:hypothetical protein
MNDSTRKPRREEFRGENHVGSHSKTETEDVHMLTQKTKTWDMLQNHPIAKTLEYDAQLALVCEYIDLYDELQGMTLSDFIDGYFAAADEGAEAQMEEATSDTEPDEGEDHEDEDEDDEDEPFRNEYDAKIKERPQSMVGMRVVYRFPSRNVLSNANGVTSDSGESLVYPSRDQGTVAFTDVDGEEWSNVRRDSVHPITMDEKHYHTIHIQPREAKEFMTWLGDGPDKPGKPAKGQPEGALLRSLFVEFDDHVDKIAFAIMNAKVPYVDRFVALPDNGFEDDQKPITRIFGEHCFWVKGEGHIVNVMSP